MVSLKAFDNLVPPERDTRKKSNLGACLLILIPVLVVAYITWYLIRFYDGQDRGGFQRFGVHEINVDQLDWGNRGVSMNLKCIATSGCYYAPVVRPDPFAPCEATGQKVAVNTIDTPDDSNLGAADQRRCYFVQQGEKIPLNQGCLMYDKDPRNTLTVSWVSTHSFGLAIESKIFDEDCLDADKVCPPIATDWVPLFYGINLMSMMEILDTREGQTKQARQYNPISVSMEGEVQETSNPCFAGTKTRDCSQCNNCDNCGILGDADNYYQQQLKALPSYLVKSVSIKYPTEVFGLVGGFTSVLMTVFTGIVWVRIYISRKRWQSQNARVNSHTRESKRDFDTSVTGSFVQKAEDSGLTKV